MAQPFLGEIRVFAFDFAPKGWVLCNGQTMAIQQNTALFSLLGISFGGNGVTTYQLPDLRGRVALGAQAGRYFVGSNGGTEEHTLSNSELPAHTHTVRCANSRANLLNPNNAILGQNLKSQFSDGQGGAYESNDFLQANAEAVAQLTPHTNMQPYTVMNACIAISGHFPPRS
jgi:microcystin-dependent protein